MLKNIFPVASIQYKQQQFFSIYMGYDKTLSWFPLEVFLQVSRFSGYRIVTILNGPIKLRI